MILSNECLPPKNYDYYFKKSLTIANIIEILHTSEHLLNQLKNIYLCKHALFSILLKFYWYVLFITERTGNWQTNQFTKLMKCDPQ